MDILSFREQVEAGCNALGVGMLSSFGVISHNTTDTQNTITQFMDDHAIPYKAVRVSDLRSYHIDETIAQFDLWQKENHVIIILDADAVVDDKRVFDLNRMANWITVHLNFSKGKNNRLILLFGSTPTSVRGKMMLARTTIFQET